MKKKNEKEVFPCDGCNRIFSGRTNHERECKWETVFGVQKLNYNMEEREEIKEKQMKLMH